MAANGQMTVAAILLAAGEGVRLGAGVPKAFCTVRGRTLLEHALARFAGHPAVKELVIVAPPTMVDETQRVGGGHRVVQGGSTRQESVRNGLAAVSADAVLVHDVARAFVPPDVIDRVAAALAQGADAVIPVCPVIDTIKRVDAEGNVVETVDRAQLRVVQTPQGFRRSVLEAAHRAALEAGTHNATDDAGLVEALGGRVVVVDGSDEAFKITRPWDLRLAEAIVDA